MDVVTYALVILAVLAVNLMPAFGPPTWSVIVLFSLHTSANPVVLVLIAAASAASGRYVLAYAVRRLRTHLPASSTANLTAAGQYLVSHKTHAFVALGLFALSPVPSAQLFEAAGLLPIRLRPFVSSFFLGRLVSYSIYVGGAQAARGTSVGETLLGSLRSPAGVALQVLMLVGLVGLARVDWARRLNQPATAVASSDRPKETIPS